LAHGRGKPAVLGDYDEESLTYLDALVASGKCLFTLATELEEAAHLLDVKPETARSQIERISRTLHQLQADYQLNHRSAA